MLGESGLETVKDVFEGGVGIDDEGNFVPATSTGLQSAIIKKAKEVNEAMVEYLEGGIDYIEEAEDFKESLQGVTESAQTTKQGILNTLPNKGNED
jgi:acyl-CoA hydrolase